MSDAVFLGYFWAFVLVFAVVNAAVTWRRAELHSGGDPEYVAESHRMLVWATITWCIPWVILGVGQAVGSLPNFSYVARPFDSVWTTGWWLSLLLGSAWLAVWIGWRGGADALARHPEFLNRSVPADLVRLFGRGQLLVGLPVIVIFLLFLANANLTPLVLPS